jgi:hypothetical protein
LVTQQFEQRTRELIDSLKAICAAYGLGNDGNEFKIITQVFLYKFLNDKFAFEAKKIRPELANAESWEAAIAAMNPDDREMLQMQMGPDTARLKPEHFIAHLFGRQNAPEFAKLFDDTLRDIAITNNDIFAVKTDGGAKITLFDRVSEFITDTSKRDAFCRAIINKLGDFSFERIFSEKYDFYAALFEYLIKDYNKDSGGKYAEYYTPHAVAKIMAAILVPENVRGKINNVSCYDPSAGSGTPTKKKPHYWGGDIPFFTPTDADGSIFKFSTTDYITSEGLKGSSTKLFSKHTVFITARGSVGRLVLAGVDMAMNQSCYALRAKTGTSHVFLFFLAKELIHHLHVKSSGSVFDSIVSNDIELTKLAIPKGEVIEMFAAVVEPAFEKIANNTKENHQLAQLRDWLLPLLMNGQVTVA